MTHSRCRFHCALLSGAGRQSSGVCCPRESTTAQRIRHAKSLLTRDLTLTAGEVEARVRVRLTFLIQAQISLRSRATEKSDFPKSLFLFVVCGYALLPSYAFERCNLFTSLLSHMVFQRGRFALI
jgi:hypothetical protein